MNYLKPLTLVLLIVLIISSCSKEEPFSSTESIGSSAAEFLKSDKYSKLYIEIDFVAGFKPTNASVNRLRTFLEARVKKPKGIVIDLDDEITSPLITYRGRDFVNIEESNRDVYTSGSTMSAYLQILDGKIYQSTAAGTNYYNTSAAIMAEQIETSTDTLDNVNSDSALSYVLIHEFGHMIGLVDIGSPMIENHSFNNLAGHCSNESCIMWPALNSDALRTFEDDEHLGLGHFCQQDLLASGGK